jgi:hypothetical protein
LLERVHTAESRTVLEAKAAALGLRAPVDTEIVMLSVEETGGPR